MMTKYGVTSGINLFIAGGVAYSIIAGTITILFAEAAQALATGGATAIPNAILAFGPLFFAILVFLVSIYVYDMKVELPLVFSQLQRRRRKAADTFPVRKRTACHTRDFVRDEPDRMAAFVANVGGSLGNVVKFIALYQAVPTGAGTSTLNLVGGLVYLISPNFPLPYATNFGGIGGYAHISHTSHRARARCSCHGEGPCWCPSTCT